MHQVDVILVVAEFPLELLEGLQVFNLLCSSISSIMLLVLSLLTTEKSSILGE